MQILHSDTGTIPTTPTPTSLPSISMIYFTPLELYSRVQSYGTLFFIQYILDNIIHSRWYLVQILPVTKYFSDDMSPNTSMQFRLLLVRIF